MGMKEFLADRKQKKATEPTAEMITTTCGHQSPFTPKGDAHDEKRREKLRKKACPDCRQKMAEEQKANAAKKEPPQKKNAQTFFRLPHDATFTVRYDATERQWRGALVIPNCPTFGGHKSGIHHLIRHLGKCWETWDKEQKTHAPQGSE